MELTLSGLMGAFEELQVCFSGSRTSRRWYTATGREARKEMVADTLKKAAVTGFGSRGLAFKDFR